MRLAEIPPYDRSPAGPAPRRRLLGHSWALERRQFLKVAGAVGVAAGLNALGVFPPARQAKASHLPGYTIHPECDGITSGAGTCAVPCGPSMIHPFACETSGHNVGFHKSSGVWSLRPNDCMPSHDPNADGWVWQVSNCQGCNPASFRCHDGYHRHADGSMHKSVCKTRIACA